MIIMSFISGKSGHKKKEKFWSVNSEIVHLLNDALHISFKCKKHITFGNLLICIDASPSMHKHGFLGIPDLDALKAALTLTTVIERLGSNVKICVYGDGNVRMMAPGVSLDTRLKHACEGGGSSGGEANVVLADVINEAVGIGGGFGSNPSTVVVFTNFLPDLTLAKTFYDQVGRRSKLIFVAMDATHVGDVFKEFEGDQDVHVVCGGDADILVNMAEMSGRIQDLNHSSCSYDPGRFKAISITEEVNEDVNDREFIENPVMIDDEDVDDEVMMQSQLVLS